MAHGVAAAAGAVVAPLQGTVVSVEVASGAAVRAGQELIILEAMKMEHVVVAPHSGTVIEIYVGVGDTVTEGRVLCEIDVAEPYSARPATADAADLESVRADLAESRQRHVAGLDTARTDAVARRRKTGHRTRAREHRRPLRRRIVRRVRPTGPRRAATAAHAPRS